MAKQAEYTQEQIISLMVSDGMPTWDGWKEDCAKGECQERFDDFGEWADHCNIFHPDEMEEAVA